MIRGIIAKKLGMTAVYTAEGFYTPVTVLQAGPCVVTQVKTEATDGYNACQLGFGEKKKSRINKPLAGHLKKSGDVAFAVLREFPVDDPGQHQAGQTITAEGFSVGEKIRITGKSKGRGFSGVYKRHGFHGGKSTHGSMSHRIPGSIGSSAWPSRVLKGKKLPGQYGNVRKTVMNLEIVDIRLDDNLILVKGAVPGPASGIVEVRKSKGI
jgi:large subunit ribosomal protein L3